MGIPLSAFQIAGGVVLFIFALTMIFGEGKPIAELRLAAGNLQHVVYPLAIPSIVSPIQRLIGSAAASIISRVMGLILAAVATHNVLSGFETYFGLHIVPLD